MQHELSENQKFLYERIKQLIETGNMNNPFKMEIKDKSFNFQLNIYPNEIQLPLCKFEDDFNALVEFHYLVKGSNDTYICT